MYILHTVHNIVFVSFCVQCVSEPCWHKLCNVEFWLTLKQKMTPSMLLVFLILLSLHEIQNLVE